MPHGGRAAVSLGPVRRAALLLGLPGGENFGGAECRGRRAACLRLPSPLSEAADYATKFCRESKQFLRPPLSLAQPPLTFVLDTNVVLDLLVFRDPACQALAHMLDCGDGSWSATLPMRFEFDAVVQRPAFQRWHAQVERMSVFWAQWAQILPAPPRASLRCADPDDQMFLDLALQQAPSVLLSRDRELLRLARPAAALGVRIAAPAELRSA